MRLISRDEHTAECALGYRQGEGLSIRSGVEMVEMLTAAEFSQAWFEAMPDKGWGWLCALGVK